MSCVCVCAGMCGRVGVSIHRQGYTSLIDGVCDNNVKYFHANNPYSIVDKIPRGK